MLFFVVIPFLGFTQQPSHFIIGEEELSGIDIYDIKQDEQKIYWLATNQGVIKFDGYTFKNIQCPEMLSTSVFDLQFNKNGVLFCKNLSGQIFQIKNDSCMIYYKIPDSLMNHEYYFTFSNKNELIIASNAVFKLTSNNIIFIEKPSYENNYGDFFKTKDGVLLIHNYSKSNLIEINNDKIKLKSTADNFDIVVQYFYLQNTLKCYDRKSGRFLNKETFQYLKPRATNNNENELLRYYAGDKYVWAAKQNGGLHILNSELQPLYNNKVVFENTFISAFYQDKESNVILGTFGEGLIIISNTNANEIILPEPTIKATRITAGNHNSVYIGTQDGRVYKIDTTNTIKLFREKHFKNIEVLEYFPESNQLLLDNHSALTIDINTGNETNYIMGSIKDVFKISENNYIIASNKGVSFISLVNKKIEADDLILFNGRTNTVGYDYINKTIYAGGSTGLKIGNKDKIEPFTLNNEPLLCKDILYFDKKIYITTHTKGVLIFKNGKLIAHWTTKTGLISNETKHIKSYQNKFYLTTNLGLQILTPEGEPLQTLNRTEGLYTNNVIDFEIQNENLWLIHQKGIQTIKISDIKPEKFKPTIKLIQLVINDSILPIIGKNEFDYTQNKFEFTVSSSSIKYNNYINYKYMLVGVDNNWQIAAYENNQIEYKSLPPGSYTFKIKALYKNVESKLLTYKFKITPPFWSTWWFYSIVAILFILITLLTFSYQFKKQKKKIKLQNELNAAKLIAIQSQMNPHFIFNTINSIQDLILKADIDNSYNYIIKLSKLVRQTLNFSDKDFIDIEDEIELLEIYLTLEKLRFKEDFIYEIKTNDLNDIQIPPMLIQPFVENAIKHGLLHQEGQKKLSISLTYINEQVIHCKIIDNGVGRKKAQEIKDRQQKNHQSFSVNATKTRFDIMKAHYQQNLGIKYIDLYKNGIGIGTEVNIILPVNQRY